MKIYYVKELARFAQGEARNQVAATSILFIGGKAHVGCVFENTDKNGKIYLNACLVTRATDPSVTGKTIEVEYEDLATLLDNVEIGPRNNRRPLEVSVRKRFAKSAHYSKRSKDPDKKFAGKEKFVYNEKGERLPVLDTDVFVSQDILDDGRAFGIVFQCGRNGKTRNGFAYVCFYETDPDYKWEGNADSSSGSSEGNNPEGKATESNAQEGFVVNG
jgi:hypothetical protein